MSSIKADLLNTLCCPKCGAHPLQSNAAQLTCEHCFYKVELADGKPLFTPVPETIEPWEKVERGPDKGTPWRQTNWRFLQAAVEKGHPDALILDVGAGHGDFAAIFAGRRYLALDIVNYPEVDVVCDLNQLNPFKPASFDLIVLMNILEHVFNGNNLLSELAQGLKPGGQMVISVPFLLKVHQEPFDFVRYTEYGLRQLAANAGLEIEILQAYYDPVYLLNQSLGNLWTYAMPESGLKRFAAKVLVTIAQQSINLLGRIVPKGRNAAPTRKSSPAPVGYLLVLKKNPGSIA